MRRFPTQLAVLTAVLTWAQGPALVRADGITTPGTADYTITVPGGLPDPGTDVKHVNSGVTLPQIEAEVQPPGAIVPPTNADGSQGSPLTILSDSKGFDQNNLVVALNNTPQGSNTPTDQKFGLVFFNGGLAADNLVHFSLSIDKSLTTPPTLQIVSPTNLAGEIIHADPAPTKTAVVPSNPTATNIPEPLSVLVWSLLAGLGLVRARGVRLSQPHHAC